MIVIEVWTHTVHTVLTVRPDKPEHARTWRRPQLLQMSNMFNETTIRMKKHPQHGTERMISLTADLFQSSASCMQQVILLPAEAASSKPFTLCEVVHVRWRKQLRGDILKIALLSSATKEFNIREQTRIRHSNTYSHTFNHLSFRTEKMCLSHSTCYRLC